jgi:type IV pilus assembly protein PilF
MNPGKTVLCVIIAIGLAACETIKEGDERIDDSAAAVAYTQLGVEYLREGNYELSLTKLERALSLDPDLPAAHDAIAVLYEKVGENKLAEKHYKKSLKLKPDNARGHNNYGQFLCFQKRYKQAEEQFLLAANDPFYAQSAMALTNAGLCATRIPDSEMAEKYFRMTLQRDPDYAPALLQMGILSFSQGNYLSARAYLQRFEKVTEHNPESLWLAIRTEFALNDHVAWGNYAVSLRNNFPRSEQVMLLQEWENERRSNQ